MWTKVYQHFSCPFRKLACTKIIKKSIIECDVGFQKEDNIKTIKQINSNEDDMYTFDVDLYNFTDFTEHYC